MRKHKKQNLETIKRLRDLSKNMSSDELRQFIHNETNNKTRVQDVVDAFNTPRATVYRIKKDPTLKEKGRKQLNSNQNRLFILYKFLKLYDFSERKIKFVVLLNELIERKKVQNTTKQYDEYHKTFILYIKLKEYLQNEIKQQSIDFQLNKNFFRQFLKILIEQEIDFIIDNKTSKIIFKNQEYVQEISQKFILNFYSLSENQDSSHQMDKDKCTEQIKIYREQQHLLMNSSNQLSNNFSPYQCQFQWINQNESVDNMQQNQQQQYGHESNLYFENSLQDNYYNEIEQNHENQIIDFEQSKTNIYELSQQYLNGESNFNFHDINLYSYYN
ncbi:hypothetical protein TTHERM_00069590 (macronuclear) [Tetrahymena thermophila SB210]|uniref:Uncharacterized protein n=1 Tax=Tetrahymena thermophila (strain SB210) TaxID=312017 RepID=I7MDG7_TETTS|nr:hypothetical protein TTHERM_00069590 [Tetrahymena thermophila SB210]EAR87552.2 hypothetical protein TTHERM_00069590 [Tetrahymena thermophila SB210]|eukprot:XP_001007797.2 hypothetical protein TTHERM_00069590 [Tetrahymena thermophila SB210]